MSAAEQPVARRRGGLHIVTWIVIAAGVIHLASDLIGISLLYRAYTTENASLGQVIAEAIHALSYTMLFFGIAAMVEFLFRISRELGARR